MDVLVPFDATDPKSRLSPLFDSDERQDLARAMLDDVLAALRGTEVEATVLATATIDVPAPVDVDDRTLSAAVNDRLEDGPAAVVVADLPLLSTDAVERLFAPEAGVVLAPGLGGGTNCLVVREPEFRADYHGASVRDHRQRAHDIGVEPVTVDSFRMAVDVDEPSDLAEVLLHGTGRTREWLLDAGITLAVTEGRVSVERS